MPDTSTPKDRMAKLMNVLRRAEEDLPEISLPQIQLVGETPTVTQISPIDLSDQHKLVLVFGAGNSGKKTLVRWLVEQALPRQMELSITTVDPMRSVLCDYFPGVSSPGTMPLQTFIELAISGIVANPCSAIFHFAADTTLRELLQQVPDLMGMLDDAGIAPVVLYTLTPRPDDLTIMQAMEAMWQPPATAAVLNLGVMKSVEVEWEFADTRRHSIYRRLMDRGGIEVMMPRLGAAGAVSKRRPLSFEEAAKGVGVGAWDGRKVKIWRTLMEHHFSPIAKWLP